MPAAFAELQDITKSFGGVRANDGVSIRIRDGGIHALVGENGAGKSTLMKVLYGMLSPDGGRILIRGKQVRITSPRTAIALGIGMLHQHFMLIPPFTVTENVILGSEPESRFGRLNLRSAEDEVLSLSRRFHLDIDCRAKIESLSVGLQQRVEILKILYRRAELLILDEPTPVLTPQEVEDFFSTIRKLKSEGKTVILITHKLAEVMEISDTVTVMRRGKVTAEVDTRSTSPRELAHLMVGDETGSSVPKAAAATIRTVVTAENVSCLSDRRLPEVNDVSFSIAAGEILGIAAVEGNGQSELVQVLAGLRACTSGRILINGREVRLGSRGITIGHIPEDRLRYGIVADFSVADNLLLGRQYEREFSGLFFLRRAEVDAYADRVLEEFEVRPPRRELAARSLSGGNQQKVVVGREFSKDADFLIASQPTRGLDIRAIDFVHSTMISARNRGKAILLVSSDLSELLSIADRIAVMYEGRITGLFRASETSERELGLHMTGSHRQKETPAA